MNQSQRTDPNLQIRRPAAAGLRLVGLGLGLAALIPSSSASVSGGITTSSTAGANNRRLQQAADVASSLFSHLKDPDLLDGDNPGWTNPPTAQPTASPTPDPVTSPNPIDTDPACQMASESFSYFRPSAASALETTPMALEVSFVYEVETTVEYGAEEMNDAVVSKVEEALGDALLPVLFDECAVGEDGGAEGASGEGATSGGGEIAGGGGADGGDATSGTGDNTGSGSGGQTTDPLLASDGSIVGMTTSPPDLAVTGADATCTTTFIQPGNSCTVVEGVLTIYVPATTSTLAPFGDDGVANQQRIDAAVAAAQDAIRSAMEGGSLNDGAVDPTVDTVTYARDGPYRDPIVALGTGDGEGGDPNGANGGLPIYVAIAGGAVAVGAALLIVGAKMRSRQNEDKEDYDSDEEEDDGEVDEDDENDVSGFHDNPTEVAERGGSHMYDMNPVVAPAPVDVPGADGPDASEPMVEGGGDWAAVGATAAVLASASDADAAAADDGPV